MNARKRILFVDDEPMVLQGLQRTFRPMRSEWDMTFAEGGRHALEMLEGHPVDVVVSDMRMPGMNGAQLLSEVMRLYPRTIRLILSGHADQDMIMQCVGAAHQFLAKPCEPETLKAVIHHALEAGCTVPSETVQQLVSQLDHLPSLPSLYTEIIRLLQRPEVNTRDVAALVEKDIGMTAGILKLVNSAYFGLGRRLTCAAEAVEHLGVETIKRLVLAVHIFSAYDGVSVEGLRVSTLWYHSQQTAALARTIAELEKASRPLSEEASVAGLLHDAGKLVLGANCREGCRAVAQAVSSRGISLCEAEREILGVTHAEVGAYVLGLWGLPASLVAAVRLHHEPRRCLQRGFTSLTAVHVADWLLGHYSNQPGAPQLDNEYLEAIGLTARMPHWRQLLLTQAPLDLMA